jgi:hypothetical protein
MAKFKQEFADESGWSRWIQPIRKGYRLGCCDCGLVHTMEFRIFSRRIQFRVRRNNISTARLRKSLPPKSSGRKG